MYKTFEVKYVVSLKRKLAVCYAIIGFFLGLAGFAATQDWSTKGLDGFKNRKEISIDTLTQAKVDAQVRLMIARTNPALPYSEVAKIARLEKKYALQYQVPLELGLAVTMQESSFRPSAKSPTGPVGLKQIATSYWAAECNTTPKGLQAVEKNIECGYYILRKLNVVAKGDWNKTLRLYYGGSPEENEEYLLTVLKKASKMADITT